MSTPRLNTSPLARSRVPRLDPAAVRSRLALVPPRVGQARRTPFVVLICALLVAGVVGLLMFNTQMQQTSFAATALQHRATDLRAQQQDLAMQLQRLRDPQELAQRARNLGMVVPADPAFVRLSDGRVLGTPTVTTPEDGMRVRAFAADKPAELAPKARVVRVPAPQSATTPATAGTTSGATGAASPATATAQGRKDTSRTHRTAQQQQQHPQRQQDTTRTRH
jgi:hypothetical protein